MSCPVPVSDISLDLVTGLPPFQSKMLILPAVDRSLPYPLGTLAVGEQKHLLDAASFSIVRIRKVSWLSIKIKMRVVSMMTLDVLHVENLDERWRSLLMRSHSEPLQLLALSLGVVITGPHWSGCVEL